MLNHLHIKNREDTTHWLADNIHIQSGYLTNVKTYKHAIQSLFKFHNESLNIWTHLIGLMSFLFLLISLTIDNIINPKKTDFYPIAVYIITVMICLGFSTIFHTFKPISYKVHQILQRLDMAGISILIFGSTFSAHCYFYYCDTTLRHIYVSLSFTSCFGVFTSMLWERMHSPEYNHIKGLSFGILGLVNGMSIVQWFYFSVLANEDNHFMPFNLGYLGTVFMGILYLTGLTFYIKKFPEKYYPKKFDMIGSSHTIFHIFVLLAAVTFYYTIDHLRFLREDIGCLNN